MVSASRVDVFAATVAAATAAEPNVGVQTGAPTAPVNVNICSTSRCYNQIGKIRLFIRR